MLFIVGVGTAAAGNLKSYEGASWYGKYLAVTEPKPLPCTSNTGEVQQLSFGVNPVNVDASHECGSQSETSIAINPTNPDNVVAGSNEIQRLPMRAMASTDGGATFTGVDLPLPPPRTQNGFDFGSDPGVAFDSNGNAYYSYIVVFFSEGGSINGTEMAVARSTRRWRNLDTDVLRSADGERPVQRQADDHRRHGNGPGHHHNRIYVAWDNATGNSSSEKNGNNVVLSYSDDGGVTFSTPVSVSGNFIGKTGGIGADPYVAPNGTLHVAWQDYAHGPIDDVSSTDGGQTFSAPHMIAHVGGFEFDPVAQATRGALVYPACGAYATTLYCSYMDDTLRRDEDLRGEVDRRRRHLAVAHADAGRRRPVQPVARRRPVGRLRERRLLRHRRRKVLRRRSTRSPARRTRARATRRRPSRTRPPTRRRRRREPRQPVRRLRRHRRPDGVVRPVWTDRRQDVIALGLREEVFTATLTFGS